MEQIIIRIINLSNSLVFKIITFRNCFINIFLIPFLLAAERQSVKQNKSFKVY